MRSTGPQIGARGQHQNGCGDRARLLTVSAGHPSVFALPWELLHDPASGGVFLFREISIRRRLAGAGGGRTSFLVQSKDRLHLLFVVSRPEGAGFLDPRADASAVLDALDEHAPGRCIWEFLRAPTLDALVARLDDQADRPSTSCTSTSTASSIPTAACRSAWPTASWLSARCSPARF